jgi:hypothetical protein
METFTAPEVRDFFVQKVSSEGCNFDISCYNGLPFPRGPIALTEVCATKTEQNIENK